MMPADDGGDSDRAASDSAAKKGAHDDRDPAVDDRDEAEFMAARAARDGELLDPADLRVFLESDEGKAFLDAAFDRSPADSVPTDGEREV